MAGDKRILIELLLATSSTKQPTVTLEHASERIRAALLINSSNNPEACLLADSIEYQESNGWQGLAIRNTDTSLSAVFEHLSQISRIPTGLAREEPDLTLQDLSAAMLVVSRILSAFEYHDQLRSKETLQKIAIIKRLHDHLLDLEKLKDAPHLDLEWLRLRCEDTLRYPDDLQVASFRELKADFTRFEAHFPALVSPDLLTELKSLDI